MLLCKPVGENTSRSILNLGSVYYNAQQNDLATFCYRAALAENPDILLARQRLDRLTSPFGIFLLESRYSQRGDGVHLSTV